LQWLQLGGCLDVGGIFGDFDNDLTNMIGVLEVPESVLGYCGVEAHHGFERME
jgi:hypothetical protein